MIDITAGHLFLGSGNDSENDNGDTIPAPPVPSTEVPFSERPTIPAPADYVPEDTDTTQIFTQQERDMILAYRAACGGRR